MVCIINDPDEARRLHEGKKKWVEAMKKVVFACHSIFSRLHNIANFATSYLQGVVMFFLINYAYL